MPVDLKEVALLVRLYVEAKDRTTLMPADLEGMDDDRRKYIETTLCDIADAMKDEPLSSYVPSAILAIRGELGLFGSMPDDHVRWVCEAADGYIEETLSMARSHPGSKVMFEPYMGYAVFIMRRMFGSRLLQFGDHSCEMGKVFDGVTDNDFYDFLADMRPKQLEDDYRKALPFFG